MKQSLNGAWRLYSTANPPAYDLTAEVPGSVYSALLKENMIENPYYRENEYISTSVCDEGCIFERSFDLDNELESADKLMLKFCGIDTISNVILNGVTLGSTNNMHREYEFDISSVVRKTDNLLKVVISSPNKYIEEKQAKTPLWGVSSTMPGYSHIRKAHYMFGWDWGPKLPDMGIWKNVELIGIKGAAIDGIYVKQNHDRISQGIVSLEITAALSELTADNVRLSLSITSPDGTKTEYCETVSSLKHTAELQISSAQLWYPRGYGSQPLYTVSTELILSDTGEIADSKVFNIGLRKIELCRNKITSAGKDDGEEFAFAVNGIKIFAMGANYIPEDHIIPNTSAEKTEKLLNQCCAANYNMIRVWGGGYYPDDYFYDICDRLGLLVWQDFMFACAVYKADGDFCETVKRELIDNVKRIRNHPSLAMWCGNNEIESMWQYWNIGEDPAYKKDYLRLFEMLAPKVLDFYDPETVYWPSSPSSGGGFNDSGSNEKGDSHYWAVWHSLRPFTDYYNYRFRFCSEYGFESLPSIKTIRTFAEENDLNLCSPVMEAHQKCEQGTEKIMYYLAQMSHYPYDFNGLIYATQMVQADAVRLNVENMRRMRGVCMGSLYWQVNDSNPVISWSSIDYYHRWKALHYCARRFYAPVLISADMQNPDEVRLNVSSERQDEFTATIRWRSRMNTGEIISQGSTEITVKPLSAEYHLTLTPQLTGITPDMRDKAYIEYSLIEKSIRLSGNTAMFVQPKQFRFLDPKITVELKDMGSKFQICLCSEAFAKSVCLDMTDLDCRFSDNWFDLHGASINVYVNKSALPENMTIDEFQKQLTVVSYYEALKLKS